MAGGGGGRVEADGGDALARVDVLERVVVVVDVEAVDGREAMVAARDVDGRVAGGDYVIELLEG